MKKIKKQNLILLISCLTFIVLIVAGILIASANYQAIYGFPKVKNASIDFEGMTDKQLKSISTHANLSGKWEFFYNRWIITDNISSFTPLLQPDDLINFPSRWTGKIINGNKLPKTGYASYRLTITNLEAQTLLVQCSYISNIPYRTFINGELCVVSGTVSKSPSESFATGVAEVKNYYKHTPGQQLTIVIEVGYNSEGGLMAYPWLEFRPSLVIHDLMDYALPFAIVGGIVVAILFCFILPSNVLKKDNMFSLALFLLALLVHYLIGVDFFSFTFSFLSVSTSYAPILRYVTGIILGTTHIYNMLESKTIVLSKKEKLAFGSINGIAVILFFLTLGTNFRFISFLISLLTLLWVFIKIAKSNKNFAILSANSIIHTLLIITFMLECLDAEGLIVFTTKVIFSRTVYLTLFAVVFLNFYRVRTSQVRLLRAAQAETEIAIMKNQTLKGQIKPHFIFNSLSAIQEIYRKNPLEGEEMLSRFSTHLRANVDSYNKDLIPFEEELSNMLNYFELENLRYEKKLILILNVEYTNFFVPALSLQPFLENAVKYAGTQNVKNGHIQISSRRSCDGSLIVEVLDNGVGFEPQSIGKTAVGIRNATERLEHCLNAQVTVKSELGSGTTVTIIIPKGKHEEDKE